MRNMKGPFEEHWSIIERPTGLGVVVYIILLERVEREYLVDWGLAPTGTGTKGN